MQYHVRPGQPGLLLLRQREVYQRLVRITGRGLGGQLGQAAGVGRGLRRPDRAEVADPGVQRRADQRGEGRSRTEHHHRAVAVHLESPRGRIPVVVDEGDVRRVRLQLPRGQAVRQVFGGVGEATGCVQLPHQLLHHAALVVRQAAQEVVELRRTVEIRGEPVEPLVGGPPVQYDVGSRAEHMCSIACGHVQDIGLQFGSHRQPSNR